MSIIGGANNTVLLPVTLANLSGIITSNLKAYYDAGRQYSYPKSGSTWVDLSGNGNNITFYNAGGTTYTTNPSGPPAFSSSRAGEFVFDGVNDYINFPTNYNLAAGDNFTANVWANGRSYSANDNSLIVSNYNGTPAPYNLYVHKNGKFVCSSRDNSDVSSPTLTSTTTITDKWYYLTYKKQGSTFSLYVNGVLEASATANLGAITPNNNIVIGQQNAYFGQPYLGKVGEVHLYNVALSDSEILHNFTSTRTRYGV